MRARVGLIAAAVVVGLGITSGGLSAATGAPVRGVIAGAADLPNAIEARYFRRHGRTCYRKCYREFVVGRRVCRTHCGPF